MKYGNLTLGQIEALVNILGGEVVVTAILGHDLVVSFKSQLNTPEKVDGNKLISVIVAELRAGIISEKEASSIFFERAKIENIQFNDYDFKVIGEIMHDIANKEGSLQGHLENLDSFLFPPSWLKKARKSL